MKSIIKRNYGITLIALVITIIILIILAGVGINLVFGNNGIIKISEEGRTKHEIAEVTEELEMYVSEWVTDNASTGISLVDFLRNKGLDYEETDEGIEIFINRYSIIVDKNGIPVREAKNTKTRPQVSNIQILKDGVLPEDYSVLVGEPVQISFNVTVQEGTITSVGEGVTFENGVATYTTTGYEMKKTFTITVEYNGEITTRNVTIDVSKKYEITEPEIIIKSQSEVILQKSTDNTISNFTNQDAIVEVNYWTTDSRFIKEISIDDAEYTPYAGPVTISKNSKIKAKIRTSIEKETELQVISIDKLEPTSAVVTPNDLISSTELEIQVAATDADATEEYSKSDMKYYKYYVSKNGSPVATSDLEETNKWTASGLTVGETYDIYAEAYDAAGNMKRTDTIQHTKLEVYAWETYTAKVTSTTYSYQQTWKGAKSVGHPYLKSRRNATI